MNKQEIEIEQLAKKLNTLSKTLSAQQLLDFDTLLELNGLIRLDKSVASHRTDAELTFKRATSILESTLELMSLVDIDGSLTAAYKAKLPEMATTLENAATALENVMPGTIIKQV